MQIDQVEATAQRLGYGAQLTHSGLQTGTVHYYWVRAINAYGKGALYALEATTTRDVDSVLDVISGSIGADDLIEELRKPLEETIDMWTAKVGNTDIGKYGGIGLTIEQDPDGVWRTKCIVDAEVFAILDPSGTTGVNARHPFIVKDGVVYMNKLLLDDAEIGSVIAKYINVDHLVGTLIEGGSFRGGDLWVGEDVNGPFHGYGKMWNAAIAGNGDAYFRNLTGKNCDLTGVVNANAGTMNNITIAENCNVLGTVYANRIVGDVCKTRFTPNYKGSIYIEAYSRGRAIVVFGFSTKLSFINPTFPAGNSIYLDMYVNGSLNSRYVIAENNPTTNFDFSFYVDSVSVSLPANLSATITFGISFSHPNASGPNVNIMYSSPIIASAFIQ